VRLDLLLGEYYNDIYEAARVKSGLKHLVDGERPTKYSSALVKHRGEKSAMSSLTVKRDGKEIKLTHIEDILQEALSFYANLYSCKLSNAQRMSGLSYLDQTVSTRVTDEHKHLCDQPISVEELGKALKLLSNSKAPGIDGLPVEFFKMFWNELKQDFLQVINESFVKGFLPDTMRLSIITLIYKKLSREDIRNYRPIS
jgi:hypothetical protein